MLHDLSLRDFRDVRLWAPPLWQNRKDVSFRIDPKLLAAELGARWSRVRAGNHRAVVLQDYNPSARPRDRRTQLRDLGRFVPALRGARILRAFAGVIDLTPDLEPVIGRFPDLENAFVCTGFSGHGYIYGPGACRGLAGLVLDGDPGIDLSTYRPERLEGKLTMRAQIF
jgi:glycine/D-amino acid oxidase-like deaminating enzyme